MKNLINKKTSEKQDKSFKKTCKRESSDANEISKILSALREEPKERMGFGF